MGPEDVREMAEGDPSVMSPSEKTPYDDDVLRGVLKAVESEDVRDLAEALAAAAPEETPFYPSSRPTNSAGIEAASGVEWVSVGRCGECGYGGYVGHRPGCSGLEAGDPRQARLSEKVTEARGERFLGPVEVHEAPMLGDPDPEAAGLKEARRRIRAAYEEDDHLIGEILELLR